MIAIMSESSSAMVCDSRGISSQRGIFRELCAMDHRTVTDDSRFGDRFTQRTLPAGIKLAEINRILTCRINFIH